MRVKFRFKREEFDKYDNFNRIDEALDKKTTLNIDRHVASMIGDVRRFTERIDLYDRNNATYTQQTGYYSFIKGLASHLAFIWYDSVPHYDLALRDMQHMSRNRLMGDVIRDMGGNKIRYNFTVPRYATGIFDYPLRSIQIFPMSFSVEYAFCVWALDQNLQFFNDDLEYIRDLKDRKDRTLRMALENLERDIVPRVD